jgi:hypothetical protein
LTGETEEKNASFFALPEIASISYIDDEAQLFSKVEMKKRREKDLRIRLETNSRQKKGAGKGKVIFTHSRLL